LRASFVADEEEKQEHKDYEAPGYMQEEFKTAIDFGVENQFIGGGAEEDCLGEDDPENAIAAAVTANTNIKQN
jgi:hypothetical protein